MERKIGEIFKYNGEWYQCIKGNSCKNCAFNKRKCYIIIDNGDPIGDCCADRRKDNKDVIFKKLENVGEPFIGKVHIQLQRYKIYTEPIIDSAENVGYVNEEDTIAIEIKENTIAIEVKENKEDVEEKAIKIKMENIKVGNKVICPSNSKPYIITEANCQMKYDGNWHDCVIYTPLYDNPYKCFVRPIKDFAQNFVLDSAEEKHSNLESTGKNLKPFNLEAAKAGKPVCTRDGRNVRIICFDTKRRDKKSIIALVPNKDRPEFEDLIAYPNNGNYYGGHENDGDLMMLPERKEGWVNIYALNTCYSSKEEAEANIDRDYEHEYVRTVKIEWEE